MESNPYRVNMLTVSTKAAPKPAPKAAPKAAPKPTPSYNGLDKDINKLVMQPMSIELFRHWTRLKHLEQLMHVLTLELKQCRNPDAASYLNLEQQTGDSIVMYAWLKLHRSDLWFDKEEYETLKQNDKARAKRYATEKYNTINSVLKGLEDRKSVVYELFFNVYNTTMEQYYEQNRAKDANAHGPTDPHWEGRKKEMFAYLQKVLEETGAEVKSSPAAKPRAAAPSGARRRS